ncbi:MAG: efflux transporter outer membrane subunit [Chlamydiales bacterium]|nr:efflux transporter outer membrane subunit [Chlamydiia bacterium]MCP5508604.1 efflux transporter outer membrane subunit [Chlamydiales bacterium]
MTNRVLLLFLSLLFTGCLVGPNYRRPCVPIPETYHYEVSNAADTLNCAWWTLFDDPVLERLIAESLAYNNNLKAAAANVDVALGILMQTRAPLFPQLGYTDSYSRSKLSNNYNQFNLPIPIGKPQDRWEAVITGSWELDFWGRLRRLVQSAQADVCASYQSYRDVLLSLVSSVASSYIQLRGLDAQLVIAKRTKDTYWEAVQYFELQFKYGQVSEMAVAQARSQYEQAATTIPQIEAQIVQTENALSVLLGRNPSSIPRGKNIEELKLPPVPAGLPSELLCQRPDILEAEMNLISANAQIGAAKALYFPSISLTGEYGSISEHLQQLFTGPSYTWNYFGTVTGPIFAGGAIYGQVAQAEAEQQVALYTYKETIQNAFAQVESALATHTLLQEQLKSQERLVAASGEYTHLAKLQYDGGYSPYFVVIQAQEQYFPAELSWADVRAQVFTSLIDIYQSMGGGWITIAEQMSDCENSCEQP